MPRCSGFTLIELSIVLVIVGLLAGGVLVGRDMIRAAEIRKTYSQYQQFATAIATFKSKYNCLPGDCPNATAFFGAATPTAYCPPNSAPAGMPTCNGNGNGLIEVAPNPGGGPAFEEYHLMWQHLANAGLIAGTYSGARIQGGVLTLQVKVGYNCPSLSSSTRFCWLAATGEESPPGFPNGNYLYMASLVRLTSISWDGFLTGAEALAYDQKFDDGIPDTGGISALPSNPFSYYGKGFCTTTDTDGQLVYLSQDTSRDCLFAYSLGL